MTQAEREKAFAEDFTGLLKFCRNLQSGFRDPFLDEKNLEIAKEYAKAFSIKYRTLKIVIEQDSYGLPKPLILLTSEKSPLAILEAAERIVQKIDTVSVWHNGKYRDYGPSEFRSRYAELQYDAIKGSIYFKYRFKGIKREITLKQQQKHQLLQLVHDDFIHESGDPELLLCMHCALKGGCDDDIDLKRYAYFFTGRTKSEPESSGGPVKGKGSY